MTQHTFPAQIIFEKWADVGFSWQGQLALSSLPRLFETLNHNKQLECNPNLIVDCQLSKKDEYGIAWLKFEVEGVLWFDCHRCLAPMEYQVASIYRTAILETESQLRYLDDEADDFLFFYECSDDGRFLPILDLLEDELLLEIPLSATHDDCTMAVEQAGELPEEPKENPFAVLQGIKFGQ